MIEDQSAKTAVKQAKCFLCQKDMAETLLSSEKLHEIFKNLTGFAAIDEVQSHLLLIKLIKKKDFKHHNSYTANYGSNMFA